MSCDCNCGCDNKYTISTGYRCYPLIVEISYQISIPYKCEAHHHDHNLGPWVSRDYTEGFRTVHTETKINGGIKTSKYIFAFPSDYGFGCSGGKFYERGTVEFLATGPQRTWHNKGYDIVDGYYIPDKPPFTKWDSSNPEYSPLKCKARMGSEFDSGEFYFEPFENPDPYTHYSGNLIHGDFVMARYIVVEVSDGKVSVEFRPFEGWGSI